MTLTYGFFQDGVTYYTQEQFRRPYWMNLLNGVVPQSILTNSTYDAGDELIVSEQDVPDLSVKVGTGDAWINGFWFNNDAEYTVSIAANTSGLTRIDRIVLHLDTSSRIITCIDLQGTPSASPVAPSLTRSGTVYELSLAQVEIPSGDSAIQSSQITDERSDVNYCGFVSNLLYHNEDMSMNSQKITYLGTPTTDTDATTKKYVDDEISSVYSFFTIIDDEMYLSNNATYITDHWERVNTSDGANLIKIDTSGRTMAYYCNAGTGTITWIIIENIVICDNSDLNKVLTSNKTSITMADYIKSDSTVQISVSAPYLHVGSSPAYRDLKIFKNGIEIHTASQNVGGDFAWAATTYTYNDESVSAGDVFTCSSTCSGSSVGTCTLAMSGFVTKDLREYGIV